MRNVRQQESLWREYRELLVRFVRRRVTDSATAEDIVHDVLVRAYENRHTLRDDQKFEQWLYQITRNAVIDHYRNRKPTRPIPDNLPDADTADSGEARAELSRCVQPFIQALPLHYRDAVQLSEIRGLTQQETADRLGLSLSGAKSRVQRARRLLADSILECCRLEFDSAGSILSYQSRGCNQCGSTGEDRCEHCGATRSEKTGC
jgi:RNA polymerase sigma-70 factor (ECF subfamily)